MHTPPTDYRRSGFERFHVVIRRNMILSAFKRIRLRKVNPYTCKKSTLYTCQKSALIQSKINPYTVKNQPLYMSKVSLQCEQWSGARLQKIKCAKRFFFAPNFRGTQNSLVFYNCHPTAKTQHAKFPSPNHAAISHNLCQWKSSLTRITCNSFTSPIPRIFQRTTELQADCSLHVNPYAVSMYFIGASALWINGINGLSTTIFQKCFTSFMKA